MKKNLLLLFLFLLSQYSFAQANNEKLDSLVSTFSNSVTVSGYSKGIAGIISEEYLAYNELFKVASNEQLIALTDHSNGIVKCYAFLALAQKDKRLAKDIAIKHEEDNQQIEVLKGCKSSIETVAKFMKQRSNIIEFDFTYNMRSKFVSQN